MCDYPQEMPPQRVALLCIDPEEERTQTFRPFSYGARRIHAALIADPSTSDDEVRVFECRADRREETRQAIEAFDPTFVGASAYVWSLLELVELAQRLKTTRPDRTIVLGGPSARPEMLALAPYAGALAAVDALSSAMARTPSESWCEWLGRAASWARYPAVRCPATDAGSSRRRGRTGRCSTICRLRISFTWWTAE